MSVNGILVIDKPAGWTSHDVVAKIRSIIKQKRVGHGGTLDPMATGVLPVFAGRATRAVSYCENADKEYIAGLRPGIVTDTQDITGNVLCNNIVSVNADELQAVLPRFLGCQKQIPPMYSAVKHNGRKLYELARQGLEVERRARDIEISAIEIIDGPPPLIVANHGSEGNIAKQSIQSGCSDIYLRVACSKGTYIRTLCHDIGAALGCGAAMSYLRRTKAGAFTLDMAHPLDEIAGPEKLGGILRSTDSIFSQLPALVLSEADTRKIKNGAGLRLHEATGDGQYRIYSPDGEFLLLGEVNNNGLKTIKSFFEV